MSMSSAQTLLTMKERSYGKFRSGQICSHRAHNLSEVAARLSPVRELVLAINARQFIFLFNALGVRISNVQCITPIESLAGPCIGVD